MRYIIFALLNLPPVIGIVFWPPMAMMSVMAFDDPASASNPFTILLVASVVFYPVPTILGVILTYFKLKQEKLVHACYTTLLSYSGIIAFLVIGSAIEIVCKGNLSCQ